MSCRGQPRIGKERTLPHCAPCLPCAAWGPASRRRPCRRQPTPRCPSRPGYFPQGGSVLRPWCRERTACRARRPCGPRTLRYNCRQGRAQCEPPFRNKGARRCRSMGAPSAPVGGRGAKCAADIKAAVALLGLDVLVQQHLLGFAGLVIGHVLGAVDAPTLGPNAAAHPHAVLLSGLHLLVVVVVAAADRDGLVVLLDAPPHLLEERCLRGGGGGGGERYWHRAVQLLGEPASARDTPVGPLCRPWPRRGGRSRPCRGQ